MQAYTVLLYVYVTLCYLVRFARIIVFMQNMLCCRQYMSLRSIKIEPHLRDWATGDLKSGLQADGSSCGSFVAMVIS